MSVLILPIDPRLDPPAESLPSFKWPDSSGYAQAMRAAEQPNYDPRNHPYPWMLCKAGRPEEGGPLRVLETRTVQNEEEHKRARAEGFMDNPKEAVAYADHLDTWIATAAAHRAYEDKRLSEKAQREAHDAEEAAGLDHLPAIPEQRLEKKTNLVAVPDAKARRGFSDPDVRRRAAETRARNKAAKSAGTAA